GGGGRGGGSSPAPRGASTSGRGGPRPPAVPADPAAYSQARALADAVAVLDGLGVERAHVVGLSMGGFTALHLLLRHPGRVLSAVVAGAGYGAQPERQQAFRAEGGAIAAAFRADASAPGARREPAGPAPV